VRYLPRRTASERFAPRCWRCLEKNGKSSLCAGIALRLLLEEEPGCEVYSCAASRDQARLVFDMARIAVEQSPILSQHLTVYRSAIVRDKTHGTYKALSAEAGIQHGLSAHGVIFDELHVSNREMWEVMLSSSRCKATAADGSTDHGRL
jgi:phage terminase large subunit-like protein